MGTGTAEFRKTFEGWATGQPPLGEEADLPLAAAALMAHAAFVEPERQIAIFDALAEAWLDVSGGDSRRALLQERLDFLSTPAPPVGAWGTPGVIWEAFWAIADGRADRQAAAPSALDLTLRVVNIGTLYDQELLERCERAVLMHRDIHTLLGEPEVRMTTNDLRHRPKESLGSDLLGMLTAKGYDLEVIDADTVLLPPQFPAQNRTNRRILQLHDVWHLFADYGFTAQGEVAISAFQLAQFGQNYSTRFLAVSTTSLCLNRLVDPDQFIALIAEGWRHGRITPPLMSVPWHQLLDKPIPQLRRELGAEPFRTRTPDFLNF
ncbi:MAG: Coq4 family protein [Steroidobacteraceae bacterium]